MFGLVAVGTFSGHVYLIDLRGDDKYEMFSITQPSSLFFVDLKKLAQIAELRETSIAENKHCCIDLNGTFFLIF